MSRIRLRLGRLSFFGLTLGVGLLGQAAASAQLAMCPVNHCSEKWREINDVCIPAGFSGKPFPVVHETGVCTCPCSCVTAETSLKLADGARAEIASLKQGDAAWNPYDEATPSPIDHLLMSDIEDRPVRVVEFDNGSRLIASPNHTLITPDEKVVSISELSKDDEVLDEHGEVTSLKSTKQEGFSGRLYNVIVNKQSRAASDHVIVLNGLQSGDWLIQSAADVLDTEIDLRTGTIPTPVTSR